jgi:hypothetical protein
MTAPTGTPTKKPAQQGKTPVLQRAFLAGTRRVDKSTYDVTKQMTTSTQQYPPYEVDPNGYYRGAYLLVEAVVPSTNSAAVTVTANAPSNILDVVQFNDQDNRPILGPWTGFDLEMAVKYGGYSFVDDMRQNPGVFVTPVLGAGATGGNTSFVLWLPVEMVPRTGLGSLANKNANAVYTIQVTLAASTSVYGVAPTALPNVRLRIQDVGYMEANATDSRGNPVNAVPPGLNTLQYWSKQTYTLTAGAVSFRLQGLDSFIRNFIFILTDASNSRTQGDLDFPDPFTLQYEQVQPINRIRGIWRHMIGQHFGYNGTIDLAGGRNSGVYPEWYTQDFGHKPGWETGLSYLPVSAATPVNLSGTITGSGLHTLTVLANKIVPAGGNPLVLTGGR